MGMKDCTKALSKLVTPKKLAFAWGESSTHKSNVLKTDNLRCDVHKDLAHPGFAIARIQVNKEAKDPGAKEFLRKGNHGPHKTTHKNVAEIRFSQINFDEILLKKAIADAWKGANVDLSVGVTSSELPVEDHIGESSKAGEQFNANPSSPGQPAWEWEWDHELSASRYWDGARWVYWDNSEGREKYWDGTYWQWV